MFNDFPYATGTGIQLAYNYGWARRYQVESFTRDQLGFANDRMSALDVPKGLIVDLHEHDNRGGNRLRFYGGDNIQSLAEGKETNLEQRLNDKVSLMTIRRVSDIFSTQPIACWRKILEHNDDIERKVIVGITTTTSKSNEYSAGFSVSLQYGIKEIHSATRTLNFQYTRTDSTKEAFQKATETTVKCTGGGQLFQWQHHMTIKEEAEDYGDVAITASYRSHLCLDYGLVPRCEPRDYFDKKAQNCTCGIYAQDDLTCK